MFSVGTASASELFGQISTNPNELPEQNEDPTEEPVEPKPLPDEPEPGTNSSSNNSAAILINRQEVSNNNTEEEKITENTDSSEQDKEIKVLGVSYEPYSDKVLLRSSDKKIYIIEGQVKKHIISLSELIKYVGQTIYDVTDEELARYQERKHLNGDLIREQGKEKIYIIENAGKRHIISFEELRAHYFGQEIFNISAMEIKLYPHY